MSVCVSVCVCVCVRVETGSSHPGHPGHVLSGSHPLYKISVSDQIDCTIRVFQSFGAWITQLHTRASNQFHIIYITIFQ